MEIISNFHATFAIYMGRALTYMCWISSGGVLTLIIFSGTKFWPTIIYSHIIIFHTCLWYKTLVKGYKEM